jgi:hypothetical protein
MKRLLTGLVATSLLIGLPLAAAAHDDGDRHRGWSRHDDHNWHWKKPKHVQQHYYYTPPPVVYYPYPAPRVVERPVYVPVPAPVPHGDPRASIGFTIFF